MIRPFIIMLSFFFILASAQASESDHGDHEEHGAHDDHHDHGGGKAIGEGKAIVKVDEHLGLKLAPEAAASIGIETIKLGKKELVVADSALVYSRNKVGVYRLRNGFFKFIEIQKSTTKNAEIKVPSEEFQVGDQLVIGGVELLRVTDIYSTDEAEYGHAH